MAITHEERKNKKVNAYALRDVRKYINTGFLESLISSPKKKWERSLNIFETFNHQDRSVKITYEHTMPMSESDRERILIDTPRQIIMRNINYFQFIIVSHTRELSVAADDEWASEQMS